MSECKHSNIKSGFDGFYCPDCHQEWKGESLQALVQGSFDCLQQEVFAAIEARGYLDQGLSLRATAARQVAKLQEELAELANEIDMPLIAQDQICVLRSPFKIMFDSPNFWASSDIGTHEAVGKEIADLGVVLFCMAECYNQARQDEGSEPFDLIEAIRSKAAADVERGVS